MATRMTFISTNDVRGSKLSPFHPSTSQLSKLLSSHCIILHSSLSLISHLHRPKLSKEFYLR